MYVHSNHVEVNSSVAGTHTAGQDSCMCIADLLCELIQLLSGDEYLVPF